MSKYEWHANQIWHKEVNTNSYYVNALAVLCIISIHNFHILDKAKASKINQHPKRLTAIVQNKSLIGSQSYQTNKHRKCYYLYFDERMDEKQREIKSTLYK